jgi:hypothetical protein
MPATLQPCVCVRPHPSLDRVRVGVRVRVRTGVRTGVRVKVRVRVR